MDIKKRIEIFFRQNHEWIIVVLCIGILIFAFYQFSLLIYPEWKNTPRGNAILVSCICLGILVNLKNIIDLIEKWFYKKDKYHFSDDEKKAIRWLFNELENKRHENEFKFGYLANGNIFIQDPVDINADEMPVITKGIMYKLKNSDLIWIPDTENLKNEYSCRIDTVLSKKAVESNFKK
jgi:hypothetical protein